MPNFTKEFLNSIKPTGKIQDIKDGKMQGLYIRISPKGAKTFYLVRCVNYKTQRIKIGRHPALKIEQARKECARLNQQIELGVNPNEEKRKKLNEPTLDDLFNIYLENHIKQHNKNEAHAIYHYNRYLKTLHKKQLSEITKLKVLELQRNLAKNIGQRTANKTTALLKAMFNRAIDWDIWDYKNPVQGVQKFKENSRERYLQEQEEERFFNALDDFYHPIIKVFFYMLFYTGARKSELLTMKWKDLHLEDGISYWRAIQSKTGNVKITPLIKQATILLDEVKQYSKAEYVFYSQTSKSGHLQSPQRAWYRLCETANIEKFRMHDIRHTGATWLSNNHTSPYIIRDYLGHSNTSITDIYVNKNIKAQSEAMQDVFGNLENRLKKDKK